jgi:uncharacterized protein YndB with AHSA1/START domain
MKVTISTTVNASIEKAWDFYTNPEHIVKWNFATDDWQCPSASNDLRAGGKYAVRMEAKDGSFGFDLEAIYNEVEIGKMLKYTMSDNRTVITTFEQNGEEVIITTVFDPEDQNPVDMQQAGWQAILDNYARKLMEE